MILVSHSQHITRRAFVERAAAVGLGAALTPTLISCAERRDAVRSVRNASNFGLENDEISALWTLSDGRLRVVNVTDRASGNTLDLGVPPFRLSVAGGETLGASDLRAVGEPEFETLAGRPEASRLAERLDGRAVALRLDDPGSRFSVTWRAVLREGSRYVRQEVTLESQADDVPITEIAMLDLDLPGARVVGDVKGSPIIAGTWFLGFEHPLPTVSVDGTHARAALARELPLRPGTAPVYSSVIGAVTDGQLRRDFLAYVERERAHPYRTFLHYNSWYDIGYGNKYDEADAVAVIEAFGTQLHQRRGVRLDSFLFDDGWDDPESLWHFHSGFPNGFTPLREAATRFDSSPGVWMSPWGGYGDARAARVKYGKEQGFETIEDRFALSGPKYYERFRDTCFTMIRDYGVNQFKFDGTGNVSRVVPGSEFDSDFDAMIALIGDLREEKPDVYVNLTTGTYPSPFFLRYADSIWRGGYDHSFDGVGTQRQRWITYRDGDTYRGIVSKGPLFPLNSLMLHGLIYARQARDLDTDPGDDFRSEIRDYFGTGTQLQEMYVTPALLSDDNWNTLAEAANWSRRNALVLSDTHWVGGDPRELEPYGWAAWRDGRATLTLRNPSDEPCEMTIDAAQAFELPVEAAGRFELKSPWQEDSDRPALELEAGTGTVIRLEPFEVMTMGGERDAR